MKKILLTGGAGFVGHHTVEHFLKNTDWEIVVIDKLSYASDGWNRLRDIKAYDDTRVKCLSADFSQPLTEGVKQEIGEPDIIVHMGANSHVDHSIKDPLKFEKDNVEGCLHMLEYARSLPKLERFIYFGTDEVYGSAAKGMYFMEGDRFNPGNPYSASKASAECFCYAYSNTYKLPIQITNTMNVFGERQHPEKFIPLVIDKVLNGEVVTIHSDKTRTKAGSRFYIHARNVADALLFLIDNVEETLDSYDASKGKFNIVGEVEMDNYELANTIAKFLTMPLKFEFVDFHSSRPGHDLRYALDGAKMANLGWLPPKKFEDSLQKTINWTLENDKWLGNDK